MGGWGGGGAGAGGGGGWGGQRACDKPGEVPSAVRPNHTPVKQDKRKTLCKMTLADQ